MIWRREEIGLAWREVACEWPGCGGMPTRHVSVARYTLPHGLNDGSSQYSLCGEHADAVEAVSRRYIEVADGVDLVAYLGG